MPSQLQHLEGIKDVTGRDHTTSTRISNSDLEANRYSQTIALQPCEPPNVIQVLLFPHANQLLQMLPHSVEAVLQSANLRRRSIHHLPCVLDLFGSHGCPEWSYEPAEPIMPIAQDRLSTRSLCLLSHDPPRSGYVRSSTSPCSLNRNSATTWLTSRTSFVMYPLTVSCESVVKNALWIGYLSASTDQQLCLITTV